MSGLRLDVDKETWQLQRRTRQYYTEGDVTPAGATEDDPGPRPAETLQSPWALSWQHMTHVLFTCETQFVSKRKNCEFRSFWWTCQFLFISLRYHFLPAVLVPTKSQEYILAMYVSANTRYVETLRFSRVNFRFHFVSTLWLWSGEGQAQIPLRVMKMFWLKNSLRLLRTHQVSAFRPADWLNITQNDVWSSDLGAPGVFIGCCCPLNVKCSHIFLSPRDVRGAGSSLTEPALTTSRSEVDRLHWSGCWSRCRNTSNLYERLVRVCHQDTAGENAQTDNDLCSH